MQPINLIGKRVILCDMIAEDIPIWYAWHWESNPELTTCRPSVKKPIDQVVEHVKEHFEKRDVVFLAIRRRSDNEFVGRLTLFNLNERNRSIEIGYMVGPPHRRQGYTREALELLLPYLFERENINKITAQTGEFNQPSNALLERFGFQLEGRLRQHHWYNGVLYDDLLYSLLASEYAVRRSGFRRF